MSPFRIIRKKIGELLVERKIVTQEQVNEALEEQKLKGGYISQHLIALGYAEEEDIAICLSNQYGFPYLPLKNYAIPSEVMDIIPLKFIKIYSLLPVDKIGDVFTVTMADPLNDGVIEMLKQITNCEISIFISTYTEIAQTMDRYFLRQLEELQKKEVTQDFLIKEGIANPFVQTLGYSGKERRRYKRIEVGLDLEFFFQNKSFQGRTKDISYIGILFVCSSFIPIDTNILCKINTDKDYVYAVVQVLRTEKEKEVKQVQGYDVSVRNYGVAGFFNFVTDEDKKKLVAFIKQYSLQNK